MCLNRRKATMRIQNTSNNTYQNKPNFKAVTISGKPFNLATASQLYDKKGISLMKLYSAIKMLVKHDAEWGNENTIIDIAPACLDSVKLTKIVSGERRQSTFVSLKPISHLASKLKDAHSGLMREVKSQPRASRTGMETHA